MGIYHIGATHLATLFLQRARDKRPLHCQVSRILGQIGAAPVRLTGFALERRLARVFEFSVIISAPGLSAPETGLAAALC